MHKTHATRLATTRRGSIYLAVMGVAMIVSIIGMVSMSIARLQLKSTQNLQDLAEARLLSQSGVEFGLGNMDFLSDWRTDMTHGAEMTPALSVGSGTMTYALVDDDGDLADDPTDWVRILGIGRVGEAVYVSSVLLEPTGSGLTSLETSLHSDDNISTFFTVEITTNQIVSSNKNVDATGFMEAINGDVEAVGTITGTINGSQTMGVPERQMPGEEVFEYYLSNGTWIDLGSLPVDGSGNPELNATLLSPSTNPFGTLNPAGIYLIDCAGTNLRIRNTRIVGTLVLLNTGDTAGLRESVLMEPAVANFPVLLVQGDIEIQTHDSVLDESTQGVNFNPLGTPYQGAEDADQSDTYPSVVKGLVYVSGKLEFPFDSLDSYFQGTVVCEEIAVSSDCFFEYDSTFLNNPPPGFSSGTVMQVVPGTWTRVSY